MTWKCVWHFLLLGLSHAANRKAGQLWYSIEIQESFKDCKGNHNEVIDASKLEIVSDDMYNTYLQGEVPIKQSVGDNGQIEVAMKIFRDDELVGREFVYMLTSDLCQHLNDDMKLPWGALFEAMNVTTCPIQAKDYKVAKLALDLDHAQKVMKHEYIGCYYLEIQLLLEEAGSLPGITPQEISCHTLGVCVDETKLEEE